VHEESFLELSVLIQEWGDHMHATLRRYEGVDRQRTDELTEKVNDTLIPRLSELPGFNGYYLIEAGNGVMSSISLFETSAQADDSTLVATEWVREQQLEKVLPNPPKVTSGPVVAHKVNQLVSAA
jgi:hypothetical protein